VGCGHHADVGGNPADRLFLLPASGCGHRVNPTAVRVANGISANRYRRADLEETMQQLGYRPVDHAWQSP
jgi:hypothetical protein